MTFPYYLVRNILLSTIYLSHIVSLIISSITLSKSHGVFERIPGYTVILAVVAFLLFMGSYIYAFCVANHHPNIRNTRGMFTFLLLGVLGSAATIDNIMSATQGRLCADFQAMTHPRALGVTILFLNCLITVSAYVGALVCWFDAAEAYKITPFPTDLEINSLPKYPEDIYHPMPTKVTRRPRSPNKDVFDPNRMVAPRYR